jgi:NAD+ kinase
MERQINRIKIYCNDNKVSQDALIVLRGSLMEADFSIVDDNPDLCIAIGGDGSFLRMIKSNNYDSNVCYVGINAGTLGFMQEIKIEDIKSFISDLSNNKYFVQEIGVQETEISSNGEKHHYYSFNEIVIREKDLNTIMLDIKVDNAHLENFVGDGVLISTSVGSTAYNLSFGGCIVFNTLHTLQVTPIAPLNSKAYRNLLNSVIVPENQMINIFPLKSHNVLLSVDGDNRTFDNVEYIKTGVYKKRVKCLRLENYNFFEKINEKFLTN